MDFFARTEIGPVRPDNQDNYITELYSDIFIGIVCDGMGGVNGGNVASQTACEVALHAFKSQVNEKISTMSKESLAIYIPVIMKKSVELANKEVYQMSKKDENLSEMGTTIVMICIYNESVFCINIGDSRLYGYSGGTLYQITKDHSYAQMKKDLGDSLNIQTVTEGADKNILTRALGTESNVKCDQYTLDLSDSEAYMICTDGLHGLLDHSKLQNIIVDNITLSAESIVNELVNVAIENGAPDNVTVLFIKS